jgi:hypothetical protein
LAAGERRAFDFVLKSSLPQDQISGRVVDERGQPLVKWVVNVSPEGEPNPQWWAYLHTDAEGRFVARGCRAVECRLEVFDPDSKGGFYPVAFVRDVKRGTNDLCVRVPDSALHFAALSGQVVDADGRPVRGANVAVRDPQVRIYKSWTTDAAGRFRAERLPARAYRVDVRADNHPLVQLGERTLAARADVELGTIVLPHGGRVALTCSGSEPRRWWSAALYSATGEPIDVLDDKTEPRLSSLMAPASYQLRIVGDGIAPVVRDVEITDDRTTNVEIALEPGREHALEVREPRAGAWRRLDIAILDAQGRRVWGFDEFSRRGNEPVGFSVTLGTGTWRVQAKTDTGLTGAATIHVPDLTAEPAPVVIELR